MANKVKASDDDDIEIWNKPYRKPGLKESTKAFENFILYRDAGINRSLTDIADKTDVSYQMIRQWSYKYKWTDRINAMNQHQLQENQRINKEIQQKEIDRINKRLDKKSKLINVLIDVLVNNAENYDNTELDIKEFSSMLNLVSRIENMNIADMNNIKELEQKFIDDGVDTQSINTLVNNFNVLLSANNSDAIDEYQDELKDDEY